MQAKRYQAFISHNSKDKPQVRRIVNELFSYFSIWFDKADMLYGEDWIKQITQGLQASDVCVVFVGINGFGPSQEKEIQLAKDLKIRICCAFLPGAVPEKIYERLQISNTTMYSNYMEGESRIAFESLAAGILGKPIGWEFLIGVKLQKRAEEWSSKKTTALLYKGDELQQAQAWKKKHLDEIGNLELVFLKASLDAQKARMMGWIVATTFILCIIGSLATFSMTRQPAVNAANTQSALQQAAAQNANATAKAEQARADEQNKIAHAGQLADQADTLTQQNPIVSFLLSVESYYMFANAQTYSVLRKNAHAYPQILRFINGTNYFESAQVSAYGIDVAAFSTDGNTIAFAVRDKIILQDVDSGKEIQVFTLEPRNADGDTNYVYGLAFSPDSKFIASDSAQGDVILWNIESGLVSRKLIGHEERALVRNLAFSSNGQMLASSSQNDDKLIVWDVSTGQTLCNINTYHEASDLTFVSQSNKFMTNIYVNIPLDSTFSETENNVLIWDTTTCMPSVLTFDQQIGKIFGVTVSQNGKIFALETNSLIGSEKVYRDGKTVTLETYNTDVTLWDVSTNQPIFRFSGQNRAHVNTIDLSPNGNTLAVGYETGDIELWDIETGKLVNELKQGSEYISLLIFNPNGNTLLSNGTLWDLTQKQGGDFVLNGHQDNVYAVAFSPDGSLLASGGQDTTIIVWDVSTQQQLCILKGHSTSVTSVGFSSNDIIMSSDLGSSDTDSENLTWDIRRLCPKITTDRIPAIQHEAPNIDLYLERREDGLRIINSSDQPIGNPLIGHPASTRIEVYLFNQSKELLASGGNDGTLMLWDVPNTRLLSALVGHSNSVDALAFSPDNKLLASGSWDGTVRVWDIDVNSWLQKICQTAGRNFTLEEWNGYFPGETYRTTCPQWIPGK